MQFYFLVGVLWLLIVFLFGWVAVVAGACAADNVSTEAERGAGYCFFPPRFCPLHCDSSEFAAVVLGCFDLCPLDCDASVIVVDCAAVETGCMLEKYIKLFFSVSATTTFLCVYSIAVAAVEKGYSFLFFGRGAAAANHFSCRLRCCGCWCLCCLQHQY